MSWLAMLVRTPFAQAAGWTLFHSLWQGAMAAAVLALLLAFLRSPRIRYAAGCVVLGTLFVGFVATFIDALPSAGTPAQGLASLAPGWSDLVFVIGLPAAPVRRITDFLPWLAPFWLAGVSLFYLKHLGGWVSVRRLRRRGVCCAAEGWQQRLTLLAGGLRVSRPVMLLESSLASVPVVIGHLRPIILMPVGLLAGLPPGQVESILLHELAHIRRHDYIINMLQTAIEGLLFYHPAVWWISHVIRAEREHCCDDVAVALGGNAHQYAAALAALERNRQGTLEPALAATGGNLVKRIRRLLIPRERAGSALAPVFSAGIIMLAGAAVLVAWQVESPYTKWMNEDVAYIITDQERATFKSLQTDQERRQFIQQFWQRRDPTPGTPRNEFMEEHYRRIAYTNQHFADTTVPGWKTDRGRIYIMFGPPDELDSHPQGDATKPYPYETWLYRFIQGIGNNVYILFEDPERTGAYHMAMDPNPSGGRRIERPNAPAGRGPSPAN